MQLIILNGPCGVGKSTAALTLHASLPLAVYLDVDATRRLISDYHDQHEVSWRLSVDLVCTMAETALKAGHDVIVDKMLFDDAVLDRLLMIGRASGARTQEFILWASKGEVMRRAERRGYRLDSLFTPEKCERFWHEIEALRVRRSQVMVLDVENMSSEQVVAELRRQLV